MIRLNGKEAFTIGVAGLQTENIVVVAEGMQTAMRRGRNALDAADEAASKTQIPLLGATVIGIMSFAAIGLSSNATGEFLFSLFAVIGTSLLLSWVLAVTVTPLFGHYFFKQEADGNDDAYSGSVFRAYLAVLRASLAARWIVIPALVLITIVSFAGFKQVKQQFFPDSNTPLFFVHFKLPQGANITRTSADLQLVEEWLMSREDVVSVTAFVGEGASRFMLTYPVQRPNPSYGHLIVRTATIDDIPALQEALEEFGASQLIDGEFRT